MTRPARLLAVLLAFSLAAPAQAWGNYTHRLIARIALANMAPATRARLAPLLAKAPLLQTPSCPLATLEDAAIWPDCVRNLGERFAFASRWHYQNISLCTPFDLRGTCPGGNCITVAIQRQLAILGDARASDRDRVQALAFVAHFVGDLHQPLHVSDKRDRGGNADPVVWRGAAGERMNLHRIWDRELAERALVMAPAITAASVSPADRARWVQGDIVDWARDGWTIAHDSVYAQLPGLSDGCQVPWTQPVRIPETYVARETPLVRVQVQKAGVRLAFLLDRALR